MHRLPRFSAVLIVLVLLTGGLPGGATPFGVEVAAAQDRDDKAGDGGLGAPEVAGSPASRSNSSHSARPALPIAAKAHLVLETHCARCHQRNDTKKPAVVSDLANILELDEIARVPSLVRPGNPDASPVYHRMFAHPLGPAAGGGTPLDGPGEAEISAVREWIEDLGNRPTDLTAACKGRSPISAQDLATAMQRWLAQIGDAAARDTRFLSIAHLRNDCATDAELAAWRQAVTKVLLGLSWSERRLRLDTVGDTLALFAVRLSELGWLAAHWERLVAAYPRGAAGTYPDALTAATGTAVPVLRADWLASTAARAPLYYELLGLPPTLGELMRLLGHERSPRTGDSGRPAGPAPGRLALRESAETQRPRIIERLAARGRPLWMAYDLTLRGEGREALDQMLGMATAAGPGGAAGPLSAAPSPKRPGVVDATRVVFALPNGFHGFGVFDAEGKRVDRIVPQKAVGGASHRSSVPGLECLACHDGGLVPGIDEMRAHVDSDRFAGDAAAREAARGLYPPPEIIRKLFDDEEYAYRRAAVQAGIDPDITVHGLEIVTALARQYDMDVGLDRAAAEFGLDRGPFIERLKSFDGDDEIQMLALRLRQGTLHRREAERLYAGLRAGGSTPRSPQSGPAGSVPGGAALAGGADPASAGSADQPLSLALWTEHASYRAGQLLAVHAAPSADCHLTIVSVDPNGKATVLFPNDFEQDNLIRGGRTHRVPARNGAYQLRLRDKGIETLIAICDARNKAPDGIEHDFERQRFTVLGDWRNFLRGVSSETARARREPERAARPQSRRVARGRNGEQRSDARAETEMRPEGLARTAIQVAVD